MRTRGNQSEDIVHGKFLLYQYENLLEPDPNIMKCGTSDDIVASIKLSTSLMQYYHIYFMFQYLN